MKILYLGNYRDGTGYGQAAEDYILALDSVGVDVACRPIKFNNLDHVPHKRIRELELNNFKKYDVVIQHTLPVHIQYNSAFDLNIALFAHETSSFKMVGWKRHINNMDCCVVINNQMKEACEESGINIPTYVVNQARDFSLYTKKFDKLDQIKINTNKNDFLFYTIGEQVKRKNLTSLLKAYFLEFSFNENVCIVVKTDINEKEDFSKYCLSISEGLGIKKIPKVFCIKDRLSNESIYRLHNSCDAFVQCSYGEAWSIPAFDAMGFGKTPIVTDCTGYKEYINDNNGWLVKCQKEPIFCSDRITLGIYNGSEDWWGVDINDLRKKMRECFSSKEIRKLKSSNCLESAYEFSYEKIGQTFLKVIKHASEKKISKMGSYIKI